jgi:hypothetical protein
MAMHLLAKAAASNSVFEFKKMLVHRIRTLATESGFTEFALAIALVLVLDTKNGGDPTAQELIRRFQLLDKESSNAIDFYFLGWSSAGEPENLTFDLTAFEEFRDSLKKNGIHNFGGNADLIILDALLKNGRLLLDFSNVLHIDLSEAIKSGTVDTLGRFLQGIVDLGNRFVDEMSDDGKSPTVWISDQLGLAIAKRSMLTFILERFGKVVGGAMLLQSVTRRAGPPIDIANM